MRKQTFVVAVLFLTSLAFGCAHQSTYKTWDKQLSLLSKKGAKADDVSFLLGTPPTKCEPLQSSKAVIGVTISPTIVVLTVKPKGPADQAGIHVGDTIKRVNGTIVAEQSQLGLAIQENAMEGISLKVETDKGVVQIVPEFLKGELCFWEVEAGRIDRHGGSLVVNQWGGFGGSRGSGYQRFFRASCKVYNGILNTCNWNWQE